MSQNIKKATDRFKEAHADFFSTENYSVGYGLDPKRSGPNGIIVYAFDDEVDRQITLVSEAKNALPGNWEGIPVYIEGRSFPYKR